MNCICGHVEEDHRDGEECEVTGCLCALYEAEADDEEEEDLERREP